VFKGWATDEGGKFYLLYYTAINNLTSGLWILPMKVHLPAFIPEKRFLAESQDSVIELSSVNGKAYIML